jgi:hypothetical protein
MLNKAVVLFESYNRAIEGAYEDFFKFNKNEEISKLKEEKAQEFVKVGIERWNSEPVNELDNQTPLQCIEKIQNADDALEFFKIGSKLCDKDLPQIFDVKLKSFGEEINNMLVDTISNRANLENDEDVFVLIMAVRLLGEWKIVEAIVPLLDLIRELDESKEIVVEEIVNALINIGNPSVQKLIDILDKKNSIGYIDEYLICTLGKIGKDNKSDAIFKCLKNLFFKMEDKILGAMCLGDYNDGRAITALRGFIEKNKRNIDKETYNEVKAAIKRLGGSIDDL